MPPPDHSEPSARRYELDVTWERFGSVVLAGSPLRALRVTAAGARVIDEVEAGRAVGPSILVDRLLDVGAMHPAVRLDGFYTPEDVTVVTPQFGGRAATDGRLVVDDASDPPIDGATVRLAHNIGPAGARNASQPHIGTALVAFVDADVDLFADVGIGTWLDALLPHFDDPAVGLVSPRIAGEVNSPLDLGAEPARIRSGTRVSYVPTAAVVARVSALDEIGWFDERLRFGEDVDLVWRLDEAGWRCRYEPASVVWHVPRSNLRERVRQHADYGSSAAPLALRHPKNLAPAVANGSTAGVWADLVAGHPVVAGAVALGTSSRLAPKLPDIPAARTFRLALAGHLRAGVHFAAAIRRVWWPMLVLASLVSRRARCVLLAALVADPANAITDLAYGWGVWRGMGRHRTLIPLLPRWQSWPQRGTR